MLKKHWKRLMLGVLSAVLMVPGGAAAAKEWKGDEVNKAKANAGLRLQCVADQRTAVKGGKIGYHILYHNVKVDKKSGGWMMVKIPDGLEIDTIEDAEWDSNAQTLKWKIDGKDDDADVVHFKLKVKEDAPNNATFTLACEGGLDSGVQAATAPVTVVLGSELHQPVFNGYPDGNFQPEKFLTRAETAAVIARVSNLNGDGNAAVYSDVSVDHWASRYIQAVTAAGYMSGSNGQFHPEHPITRGEFVTLMLRVRGIDAIPMMSGFTDTDGHWANDAAATAAALRFMEGSAGGRAQLDGAVERQMAAKWLSMIYYRGALQDGETQVIQHWPDVQRGHWSFGWVEELSMIAHEGVMQSPMEERLIRYVKD
ncbi:MULTISPECIES: S-layer homology domain-containing protein [unclassified Paenibacillus]|uniref:S-layer homology domain-containing protein n=1 Tax=unclassified Paenibacillus TaxID=185978 RepID=UPI001AEA46B1|nr:MULTISPECIES: S-layer homology domain-containing protein [unclassified Paenibacillus]MBP1156235.1 hypothetical protein [Paenibacillus sp. PvP091]MBP1168379.1 hypothetical protein [Paenibacillus sp. PvR098]MBP2439407.1 hypothetical protein [Paenibacillus sp. PvP052]